MLKIASWLNFGLQIDISCLLKYAKLSNVNRNMAWSILESIIACPPYLDYERFLLLSSSDSLSIFYKAKSKDRGIISFQLGSLNYHLKQANPNTCSLTFSVSYQNNFLSTLQKYRHRHSSLTKSFNQRNDWSMKMTER